MAAACSPPVAPEDTRISRSGVIVQGVVALLLGGDGLAEAADAVKPGVDIVAVVNGLDGGFLDRGRDRRVADALCQIDAAQRRRRRRSWSGFQTGWRRAPDG